MRDAFWNMEWSINSLRNEVCDIECMTPECNWETSLEFLVQADDLHANFEIQSDWRDIDIFYIVYNIHKSLIKFPIVLLMNLSYSNVYLKRPAIGGIIPIEIFIKHSIRYIQTRIYCISISSEEKSSFGNIFNRSTELKKSLLAIGICNLDGANFGCCIIYAPNRYASSAWSS